MIYDANRRECLLASALSHPFGRPLDKLLTDPRFLKMQENGYRTREKLAAGVLLKTKEAEPK